MKTKNLKSVEIVKSAVKDYYSFTVDNLKIDVFKITNTGVLFNKVLNHYVYETEKEALAAAEFVKDIIRGGGRSYFDLPLRVTEINPQVDDVFFALNLTNDGFQIRELKLNKQEFSYTNESIVNYLREGGLYATKEDVQKVAEFINNTLKGE